MAADARTPMRIVPVIMSGGSGTRLWPLSTDARPKQFHPLGGAATMIQATALRFSPESGLEMGLSFLPPIIICNRAHEALARDHLKAIGVEPLAVVLEPFGRNTAAVAAMAAKLVQELCPGALAVLLPADHVIADERAFRAAVACGVAASTRIVTFGITPTAPETGYGYIQSGAPICEGVFEVVRFAEKPARAIAEAYVAEGGYSWNGGIFLFAPEVMLSELEAHRPDILTAVTVALDAAEREDTTIRLTDATFAAVPSESVDVAVMEPTRLAAVAPCTAGWADIGSWSELWRLGDKDARGNVTPAHSVVLDSDDCMVWADIGVQVGVVGLRDVIVVAAGGAVVVLPKDRAQDVKRVVETLRARKA
ncbi:mannose-1-phosphate guanylyltransferase [Caulobacter sp. S45]|uniref:mannose-1-phosphate guanylyltransferase n=1 Tax=Caulobacter sp. S45 TaxID=1641861 RepID=UPI0020B1773A|nr:sugar phosphate nucleotidyltransferase [Caulobacter sp. S45]